MVNDKKNMFLLLLLLVICLIFSACTKKDEKKPKDFNVCKPNFEEINKLLLSNYESEDEKQFYMCKNEKHEITEFLYNDNSIVLTDTQLLSINSINKLFVTEFSFIRLTKERITYCGLGNEAYVYSRDGEKPDYFYSKDDGERFTTYSLGDNWYLIIRPSN